MLGKKSGDGWEKKRIKKSLRRVHRDKSTEDRESWLLRWVTLRRTGTGSRAPTGRVGEFLWLGLGGGGLRRTFRCLRPCLCGSDRAWRRSGRGLRRFRVFRGVG